MTDLPEAAYQFLNLDPKITFTEIQSTYLVILKTEFSDYFLNNSTMKNSFLQHYSAYQEIFTFFLNQGENMDEALLPDEQRHLLHYNRALYHLLQKEFSESVNQLEKSLNFTGDSGIIYSLLAWVSCRQADYETSRRWAKQAIKTNSNNSLAWIVLAKVFFIKKKSETALQMLETASRVNPGSEVLKMITLLKNPAFQKIKKLDPYRSTIRQFLDY